LIANLLRIQIGRYLITPDFRHLAIENDFDKSWDAHLQQVRNQSHVIVVGPTRSRDYESALQNMLDTHYEKHKAAFFQLTSLILVDFIRWDNGKTDISKVIESLKTLNVPDTYLLELNAAKDSLSLSNTQQVNGHSLIPESIKLEIDEKLCFVIMPFAEKLNPIYENIIKPVVTELKLNPLRADEIFKSTPILDDIIHHIKKAKFLIADLTDRNPNVFYELGLAHALNKEVILLSQSLSDIPFDLQHFRIIIYQDSIAGADILRASLKKFIKNL